MPSGRTCTRVALVATAWLLLALLARPAHTQQAGEQWVAVSRHALREHTAASAFFADTVAPQHVVRHEHIGRFHIYVLDGVHDGHPAHAYFAGHAGTRLLTRNHPIHAAPATATAMTPVDVVHERPRTRTARYNPWLHGEARWMVEGAACRTNAAAEGQRGYSAGGFSWAIDRLDQHGAAARLDDTFCTPAVGTGAHVYILDTGVDPHATFRHPVQQDYSWYASVAALGDVLHMGPEPGRPLNMTGQGQGRAGGKAGEEEGDARSRLAAATGDCHGHGTHVGGLAASTLYGVAPDATVHAIQVLDCQGRGSFDALIAGLLWVMEYGARPAVANLSLGVRGQYSASLAMLIEELVTLHGVPVVVSAGNDATDACDFFPASVPEALTVAASAEGDALAGFSNRGACVDIVAPGNRVVSCAPANGTAILSGTSMSAPIVAGMLALLQQAHPTRAGDAAWLTARLLQEARPLLVAALDGTPNALAQVTEDTATPRSPVAPAPSDAPTHANGTLLNTLAYLMGLHVVYHVLT